MRRCAAEPTRRADFRPVLLSQALRRRSLWLAVQSFRAAEGAKLRSLAVLLLIGEEGAFRPSSKQPQPPQSGRRTPRTSRPNSEDGGPRVLAALPLLELAPPPPPSEASASGAPPPPAASEKKSGSSAAAEAPQVPPAASAAAAAPATEEGAANLAQLEALLDGLKLQLCPPGRRRAAGALGASIGAKLLGSAGLPAPAKAAPRPEKVEEARGRKSAPTPPRSSRRIWTKSGSRQIPPTSLDVGPATSPRGRQPVAEDGGSRAAGDDEAERRRGRAGRASVSSDNKKEGGGAVAAGGAGWLGSEEADQRLPTHPLVGRHARKEPRRSEDEARGRGRSRPPPRPSVGGRSDVSGGDDDDDNASTASGERQSRRSGSRSRRANSGRSGILPSTPRRSGRRGVAAFSGIRRRSSLGAYQFYSSSDEEDEDAMLSLLPEPRLVLTKEDAALERRMRSLAGGVVLPEGAEASPAERYFDFYVVSLICTTFFMCARE